MFQENDQIATRRSLKRAAVVGGCILALVLAAGIYSRWHQARELQRWTAEADVPTVQLISPASSGKDQTLILPGTLQAFYDAPIYSRVPGYVHAWYKDIGAHVKKGDLLALIDTPELDQQISQAKANLGAAVAAETLSDSTAQRWRGLLPLGAVSREDAESKEEDLLSKSSAVHAAQASLDQLVAMKHFSRIVAPFDGIVTKRTADVGALVAAGPSSSGDPLFAVSDSTDLRVYVNVPQSYSTQIVPKMTASLMVPEYPGRVFPATLVSTSNSIGSTSSALLVEFKVSNKDDILKPGAYATVSMVGAHSESGELRLPASALMFRSAGLQVATVSPSNRVVMKSITVGTDMGTQVTVASGLSPTDRVVNNPLDSLTSGVKVRIADARDVR